MEEYNTVVKLDVRDAILEYLKNNNTFKMFCTSLDGLENIQDISFSFKYNPKPPKEKAEYYTDRDGTKCFGVPHGNIKAKLNDKARRKLEDLRVDVER